MLLQFLMFNVQKGMVVDIWESDDRRLLLRFLRNNGFKDKAGWSFGDNHTFTVYEVEGEQRKWDLTIAIPRGCKVARPCIDGVDFLQWSPDGNHADGTMSKQAVIDAIVEALQNANPDDLERTAEGELIIHTGIVRRPDGSYHEKL